MPSNLLQADVGFPQLNEQQSQDEKITQIVNYLYMLLEQLRYNFGNLGIENFNDSGIEELQHVLTEPVFVRLENDEGLINELSVDYTGLYSRLYDETTGDITQLSATAQGLSADMYGENGRVTQIGATASGLYTEVWGAEPGENSRITQNANAITLKVSQGDVDTSISTFASGLALSVTNGANSSNISITSGGVVLNTQTIQITGMVRFATLGAEAYNANEYYAVGDQCTYGGYLYTCTLAGSGHTPGPYSNYWTQTASASFINGGNIKTGSITADLVGAGTLASTSSNNLINLKGYLGVKNANGTSIGYLGTYESASATVFGMYYDGLNGGGVTVKQDSANIGVGYAGINVVRNGTDQYISFGAYQSAYSFITFHYGYIRPETNGGIDLGSSSYKWKMLYSAGLNGYKIAFGTATVNGSTWSSISFDVTVPSTAHVVATMNSDDVDYVMVKYSSGWKAIAAGSTSSAPVSAIAFW